MKRETVALVVVLVVLAALCGWAIYNGDLFDWIACGGSC